jgi:diguanylate cyclase (GGDEF)-like protein/PAS domain S-box-containing protein
MQGRPVPEPRPRRLGKEYFESLFDEVPEAIMIGTPSGVILKVNDEFTRMFGYGHEEARGRSIDDLIARDIGQEEAAGITRSVAFGHKIAREAVRRRKDGSLIHVSILGVPVRTRDRQVAVYGIYRDISDRKQAEQALQLEKAYLEQLVETASEGIAMLDVHGCITLHNSEFCRLFGYRPEEVAGRRIDDLILPGEGRAEGEQWSGQMLRGGHVNAEALRKRKDGTLIHVSIIGSPIVLNGQQVGSYTIYRDISGLKRAQEEILRSQRQVLEANAVLRERSDQLEFVNDQLQKANAQLELVNAKLERSSNYDGLTAIPNRRCLERFYDLEWRRAARDKQWLAVIMIDVDHFKAYNDRHGHLAGDECLKRVALALQVVNRASDLVARYGGEEFVAVLSGTDLAGACQVAERMRQQVRNLQLVHGGGEAGPQVTISMGVAARIPDGATPPEELLQRADQALYRAKAAGRDQIQAG